MITLTREEAQELLDALKHLCLYTAAIKGYDAHKVQPPIDMLKAKLKQPEQVIQARKEGDLIVVDLPQVPTGSGGIHKESEPVAYINVEERKLEWATPTRWETPTVAVMDKVPLYTAPPQRKPKPEPVAWTVGGLITDFSRDFSAYKTKTYTKPLYTAPPQREWQGLTDEEIMSLLPGAVRLPPGWADTVRAIETKLREKNSG